MEINLDRYYQLNNLYKTYKLVKKEDRNEFGEYSLKLRFKQRWNNRKIYVENINRFLNGFQSAYDFYGKFLTTRSNEMDAIKQELYPITVENFETTPIMEHFAHLVDEIYLIGEQYDRGATAYEDYDKVWFKETVLDAWNEFLETSQFDQFD